MALLLALLVLLTALAPSVSRLLAGPVAGAMLAAGCPQEDAPRVSVAMATQGAAAAEADHAHHQHDHAMPATERGMDDDDDGMDEGAGPSPAAGDTPASTPPGPGPHDHHALCPFCLPHAGSTGFLPVMAPVLTLPPEAVHEVPPLYYAAPRPLFAWAAPLARAPPQAV